MYTGSGIIKIFAGRTGRPFAQRMCDYLGAQMGDATTIMAETYEKIGACVPADRRAVVSEMQVFDFIDPGVAEPLISVQDKLEGFQMQPGGRNR